MLAHWLHHPCRLGSPQRFRVGDKISNQHTHNTHLVLGTGGGWTPEPPSWGCCIVHNQLWALVFRDRQVCHSCRVSHVEGLLWVAPPLWSKIQPGPNEYIADSQGIWDTVLPPHLEVTLEVRQSDALNVTRVWCSDHLHSHTP